MSDEPKPGDHVEWNGPGKVRGTVEKELTERTKIGEHVAAASPENPEYLVKRPRISRKACTPSRTEASSGRVRNGFSHPLRYNASLRG